MKINYHLETDVETPYTSYLIARMEDKFYQVAEIKDINRLARKELSEIDEYPGAYEALLKARQIYSDAVKRIPISTTCEAISNEH